MKTKAQLQEEFGWVGPRFFLLNPPLGMNPYAEASFTVPGHLFVARADDKNIYVSTDYVGEIQSDILTEIME